MNETIRIIVADDMKLTLHGAVKVLADAGYDVVATAENGEALLAEVEKHRPDIVFTDIEMPVMNGIEATKKLHHLYPELGIIALSMYGDEYRLVNMLESGARGYLMKTRFFDEYQDCIEAVYEGVKYYCSETNQKLIGMIADNKKLEHGFRKSLLNEREVDVARLMCQDYSTQQMSEELHLSTNMISKYRDRIKKKTGARNTAGVVIYCIKSGIYQLK